MQKLTTDQISLIQLSLMNGIKNNNVHSEKFNEILEIIELGCDVEVLSCDEATGRIMNEVL